MGDEKCPEWHPPASGGSLVAAPIVIPQPQSAILGVGKLERRPVARERSGKEAVEVRPMCYVPLTIDHRVLDGFQANAFLARWVEECRPGLGIAPPRTAWYTSPRFPVKRRTALTSRQQEGGLVITSPTPQVLDFLKSYVMGKAVIAAPVTAQTDDGRLAEAYEEDAVYSNLVERARGFSFDLTTLARGTRYVTKERDGLLAEGTLNAVRVIRYDMTERASSGRLVGHARIVSSTNSAPDPFEGVVFLVQMAVEKSALKVYESMTGYADFPVADGTFKPGAVDGVYTYSVHDGNLTVSYEQKRFDVDPNTLARTPTGDKFPVQVSHEITFPDQTLATV